MSPRKEVEVNLVAMDGMKGNQERVAAERRKIGRERF